MGLALCGAELATQANSLDVGHLHVHSCADAAHVAAACALMGGQVTVCIYMEIYQSMVKTT